ncbi:MAG TPA: hemolysin family protein [Fimbriimonas sp.]|nr:hemolysin family protein [Fimbriimonas sp.]
MSDSPSGEHNAASPLPPVVRQILFGFSRLFVALGNVFARPAGGAVVLRQSNQMESEIRSLVDSAEESGEFEADETELIHSVLEFSETVAREIMTPRTDLDAAPSDINPYDLVEMIQESGHSRIPIYEGTDDDIVGVVHAKDLFLNMLRGKPVNLQSLMRLPIYVTENRAIDEVLAEMRKERAQMAVVKDEFGGTSGIVTIEDIIEELVGEIQDEHDDEEPDVSETLDGFLVEGKTHLDDVNEELGSAFTSEDFDTIGGFVFGLFGRQPKKDEWIEHEGFQFRVMDTDGKRIIRLQVVPLHTHAPLSEVI